MTYDSTQDNFLQFEKLVWGSEILDLGSDRPDLESEGSNLGSEKPDLGSDRPDLGSERSDLGSERHDSESETPDLGSEFWSSPKSLEAIAEEVDFETASIASHDDIQNQDGNVHFKNQKGSSLINMTCW